ncbi:MAG: O-antigen ligase family protein [Planctomycetota bacterium]|nr:O-antigen ligase family protein [Planctomycetota bacterium]
MEGSSFRLPQVGDGSGSGWPNVRTFVSWLMVLTACLAPVAGGCQFRWGWGALVAASGLLLLCRILPGRHRAAPLSGVFVGLAILHVLQLVPLPRGMADALAPTTARVAGPLWGEAGWRPLSANLNATRDNLLVLLACWVAFELGYRLFRRPWWATRLGLGLLVTAALLSAYGMYALNAKPSTKWLGIPNFNPDRLTSTYTNPNRFAGFLELTLPMGLVAVLGHLASAAPPGFSGLSRYWNGLRGSRGLGGLALGIVWVLGLIGLALTQSRMGMAAFGGGFAVAFLVVYRHRLSLVKLQLLAGFLAALLLAGMLLGLDPVLSRYSLLFEADELPADRLTIWSGTLRIVADHWPLGGGSGAFRSLFPHYQPAELHGYVKYAHNDYLNALADLGAGGALLLLGGLGLWLYRMVSAFGGRSGAHALTAFGILWSVIALLLHSLTDFNLQEPANAWLFCLWLGAGLGVAWSAGQRDDDLASEDRPASRRGLAAWGLLALLLLAGGMGILASDHSWPANLRAGWPQRFLSAPEASEKLLQKVRRYDPLWTEPLAAHARAVLNAAAGAEAGRREELLQHADELSHDLLRLTPLNAEAWYQRARVVLTRDNDLEQARFLMEQAGWASPHQAGVALLRGRIALLLWRVEGRPGLAVPEAVLDLFAGALRENPRNINEVLALLFEAGPWEARWSRILPPDPEAHARYARVLAGQGLVPEAEAAMGEALKLLDAIPEARRTRAERRLRTEVQSEAALLALSGGRTEAARALLRATLEELPLRERGERGFELWRKVRRLGAPDSGLELTRFLAESFPDQAWAFELQARAATDERDFAQAEKLLRASLKLEESAPRYALLAQVLSAQDFADSALAAIQHACDLEPSNGRMRLALAELLSRRGYHDRAVEELILAEQLDPGLEKETDVYRRRFMTRRASLRPPRP